MASRRHNVQLGGDYRLDSIGPAMPEPTEMWTMGELLVEIMRPEPDIPLGRPGPFLGPYPSGAPGIFIDAVARLGHRGGIVSGVGDDAFGRLIVERLARDGVRTDHVMVMPGRSTGVAFISYAGDGSRGYIFHWAGTPAVMAPAPPPELAAGARILHIMGCSLMADRAFAGRIIETVDRFAAAGTRITFDPNIRAELLTDGTPSELIEPILRAATILLPGEAELRLLSHQEDLDAAAADLARRYHLELVAVKLGPRGCIVYTDDRRIEVPAFEVIEVDPTGAGDCFDAGFLCGLLEGMAPEEAARLAAAAGALAATAFGPMEGPVERATVEALLARG
jgi:sugar/nucleoside kinase (ribokinase family)